MIVFENELGRLVEVLPAIGDAKNNSYPIKYNWGTEEVLNKYLKYSGKESFPLIWLENGQDTNDLREQSVTRMANIIILNEMQAPEEFNPYQYQYDFDLILQPIANNLVKALTNSGISRFDDRSLKSSRITKYSMRNEDKSLIFICNSIVINANITFSNVSSCLQQIQF